METTDSLHNFFKPLTDISESKFFEIMSLLTLDDESNTLYGFYQLFGFDGIAEMLEKFGGRKIQFPTSDKFKDSLIVAMCYYYREIKGMKWRDIKSSIPFEFDSQKVSMKIMKLDNRIKSLISSLK